MFGKIVKLKETASLYVSTLNYDVVGFYIYCQFKLCPEYFSLFSLQMLLEHYHE